MGFFKEIGRIMGTVFSRSEKTIVRSATELNEEMKAGLGTGNQYIIRYLSTALEKFKKDDNLDALLIVLRVILNARR